MKKCNTEVMKEVKNLTMKIVEFLNYEQRECLITYSKNEEQIVNKYDYSQISKKNR